jgi:hypothetical protein
VDVATSQAGKSLAALYKAGHWPIAPPGVSAPLAAPGPAASLAAASPKSKPRRIADAIALRSSVTSTTLILDADIKLNGIAYGKNPLAIINGKGLAAGETVAVALKSRLVNIKCIKIETNSVLVSVDGEEIPVDSPAGINFSDRFLGRCRLP